MAGAVCYLEADASGARVVTDQGAAAWKADAPAEADPGAQPAAHLRRIGEAAAWATSQLPSSQRFDIVCLGVDRSLCTWISAPSTEPQVIMAAVRQREQDWGVTGYNATVQPLGAAAGPDSGSSGGSGGAVATAKPARARRFSVGRRSNAKSSPLAGARPSTHMAVLRLEDGAARLWLDELDRRGVRVGAVTTLWHAIGHAWGATDRTPDAPADDSVVAVALIEPGGRITWSWSDAEGLLAGGVVSMTGAREGKSSECGRLVLDWLTWSAQLGRSPDRVRLVGAANNELTAALRKAWPAAPIEVVERDDPIGATLAVMAAALESGEAPVTDPRACVVELSTRPGRVHRRLYTWSAAAIALLAAGVAGLGWQMRSQISDMQLRADEYRATALEAATAAVPPAVLGGANTMLPRALEAHLAKLRQDNPEIVEPPPPPAVLDELMRMAEELKSLEGTGASVDRLVVSFEQSTAVIRTKDVPTADALRAALTASEGPIRWNGRISGGPPNVVLTLSGEWRLLP